MPAEAIAEAEKALYTDLADLRRLIYFIISLNIWAPTPSKILSKYGFSWGHARREHPSSRRTSAQRMCVFDIIKP